MKVHYGSERSTGPSKHSSLCFNLIFHRKKNSHNKSSYS